MNRGPDPSGMAHPATKGAERTASGAGFRVPREQCHPQARRVLGPGGVVADLTGELSHAVVHRVVVHRDQARGPVPIAASCEETGATKVDVVAHSQGGVMARDYIKTLGGDAKIDSLVTYGTPHYGTNVASLATQWSGGSCFGILGCAQQATGSSYLNALNAGDDSIGAVRYTAIATEYDSVTTPYRNAFLDAADGNITNVSVQQQCGTWRWADHFSVTYDAAVIDGVVDALDGRPVQMNCFAV